MAPQLYTQPGFARRTFLSWMVWGGGRGSGVGTSPDGKQFLILEENKELVSGKKGPQSHTNSISATY